MCPRRHRLRQSQAGIVLVSTIFLMALLLVVGLGALRLSQTDVMVARNGLSGVQTLWVAHAGAETAKNWLEANIMLTPLPVTLGPMTFGDGTYTADVTARGGGAYRIVAVGRGPEGSRRVIEEVVRIPDFTPAAAVTSDGDGLHPDFDDLTGGVGRRIPDFTIDGRNHAPDGTLSARCPAVSPLAVTQAAAQTDLLAAADTLKRQVVARANAFCTAGGGSTAAGACTPGLAWVRGPGVAPRFTDALCVGADPACFVNLDPSAAALRATGLPPETSLPAAPQDRGPFAPAPAPVIPFARLFTGSDRTRLQAAVDAMLRRVSELPPERLLHVSASIASGTVTYGTPAAPKITQVEDGGGPLDVSGGATVNGVGVLLIPRVLRLRDATFNWRGLVVIVDDGDLRVEHQAACGQITGAVIIRDDAANDRKFDLDRVEQTGGCPPFAVVYSCETVARALALFMRTESWTEQFEG